jgi:hypothetical protein
MGQLNGKVQKPFEEDKDDNYIHDINALTAELDKVNDENNTLREKLREAEEKVQMAKTKVKKT